MKSKYKQHIMTVEEYIKQYEEKLKKFFKRLFDTEFKELIQK